MARHMISARGLLISAIAVMLCAVSATQTMAQDEDDYGYRHHSQERQHYRHSDEVVRIENRWKPDQALNIEHGRLDSSEIRDGWYSARWVIEDAPRGYVRLRNYWKGDRYINSQSGEAQAGPIQRDWWSAMWRIEPVYGTDYVRLRSRWKPNEYLNIQDGRLSCGPIDSGWWSAMWRLEPAGD